MFKRIIPIFISAALLLTACDPERNVINIEIESDYSALVSAIKSSNATLLEKLDAIEQAFKGGNLQDKDAYDLVCQALASLSGTAAEKLGAIETAIKSGTTSLEAKIALIEASVKAGFADKKSAQDLLKKAVESLSGTASEKLGAVESAVKGGTASLETKLGLVEAAVSDGFADGKAQQELIAAAFGSLQGSMEDKLGEVGQAISSQTLSLETKLGLIETAFEETSVGYGDKLDLIKTAIETLQGSMEDRFEEISDAVGNRNLTFETKLEAIATAFEENVIDPSEKLDLIQGAIETLQGSMETALGELQQAMANPNTDLATKLEAITTAITNGFADNATALGLIQEAIGTLQGSLEEKLEALAGAMADPYSGLTPKLEAIETAINNGFAGTPEAIGLIQEAFGTLAETVDGILGGQDSQMSQIVGLISDIAAALGEDGISTVISNIDEALATLTENADYSEILDTIYEAVVEVAEYISENVDFQTTASPVITASDGNEETTVIPYQGSLTVTITAEKGATVYYSTDGSDPGPDTAVYTEPFVVSSACTVKAVAVRKGKLDSCIIGLELTKGGEVIVIDFSQVGLTDNEDQISFTQSGFDFTASPNPYYAKNKKCIYFYSGDTFTLRCLNIDRRIVRVDFSLDSYAFYSGITIDALDSSEATSDFDGSMYQDYWETYWTGSSASIDFSLFGGNNEGSQFGITGLTITMAPDE